MDARAGGQGGGPGQARRGQRRLWQVALATGRAWSADRASMWSAAVAFYSMLSLGPLMFAAAVVGGLCVGRERAEAAILAQVAATIGPQGALAARTMMAAAYSAQPGGLGAWVGGATLVFAASGVFSALQDAVDAIWHVAPRPAAGALAWARRRFASMSMVVGVGFLSTVSLLVSAVLAAAQASFSERMVLGGPLAALVDTATTLVCFTALFAAVFKILPDARLGWSEVLSGAGVTAILFALGKGLLAAYLARMRPDSPFGAASSLAAVLIWVYYAAQVFFVGAAWVRADLQHRGGQVEPDADAVRVHTVAERD